MDFAPRGQTPDRTIPRFHSRPVEMPFASRQAGRPIFEDREFVEIIIPGMPKSTACEPVNDGHKQRWPQQYEAFRRGIELPQTGTPLEEWPALSSATVLNMKGVGLRTVDDLAAAPDAVLHNLGPGGMDFRRRAQAFLESAKSNAPMEALEQENQLLKAKVEVLEGQVRDLAALAQGDDEEDAEPTRRGPGRPRKVA